MIKNPTALVTRYYFALKERPKSDIQYFFKHECVSEPPSLAKDGNMYFGTKSKLVDCLPGVPQPGLKDPRRKAASVIIFDGKLWEGAPSLQQLLKTFDSSSELSGPV